MSNMWRVCVDEGQEAGRTVTNNVTTWDAAPSPIELAFTIRRLPVVWVR